MINSYLQRGLILAPTRELANQIAVELGTLMHGSQLNTFVVVGGKNINTQVNKLKARRTDLLVATPGRLIDLMDRGALSLEETTFLVLDEADLMLGEIHFVNWLYIVAIDICFFSPHLSPSLSKIWAFNEI